MSKRALFLQIVLGPYGVKAMAPLQKGSEAIDEILVPRAAIAWVNNQFNYDAEIPGIAGSILRLNKSEGFSGEISINNDIFKFENAPAEQITAAILLALGVTNFAKSAKSVDLARLGKTIDMLVQHRQLQKNKDAPEKGQAAAPVPPTPPAPVEDYKEKQPTDLVLSEEEGKKKCEVCGSAQVKKGKFKGCHCLTGLVAKSSTVDNGIRVQLENWDADSVSILLEAIGRQ